MRAAFDDAMAAGEQTVAVGIAAWRLRCMLVLSDNSDTSLEAQLRSSLGTALDELGDPAAARVEHQQALDLLTQPHLGDNPDLDSERARLHMNLGISLRGLGDLVRAKVGDRWLYNRKG